MTNYEKQIFDTIIRVSNNMIGKFTIYEVAENYYNILHVSDEGKAHINNAIEDYLYQMMN